MQLPFFRWSQKDSANSELLARAISRPGGAIKNRVMTSVRDRVDAWVYFPVEDATLHPPMINAIYSVIKTFTH